MTDHKFQPGQLVLVRNSDEHKWRLMHYSHFRNSADEHFFATIGEHDYRYCLPFNEESKHLHNTTQPYEPPKPPVEHEWGQKVEVMISGEWEPALYLKYNGHEKRRPHNIVRVKSGPDWVESDQIRPLPDTASHLDAKP